MMVLPVTVLFHVEVWSDDMRPARIIIESTGELFVDVVRTAKNAMTEKYGDLAEDDLVLLLVRPTEPSDYLGMEKIVSKGEIWI